MGRFRRRGDLPAAQVGAGFVATEAPALAASIRSVLGSTEIQAGRAEASLTLRAGSPGQVVVSWRNRHVGFVPTDRRAPLLAQLAEAAALAAPGVVYRVEEVWRVWVGPEPAVLPDPGPGHDELEVPVPSIFGIAVPGLVRSRARGDQRWLLTVDRRAWSVRDGVDADLDAWRRSLAAASVGDRLELSVRGETVHLEVGPDLSVTLAPADGGPVQVLHRGG